MNAVCFPIPLRALLGLCTALIFPTTAALAAKPNKAEIKEARREGLLDVPTDKASRREDKAATRNERESATSAESRQSAKLRERLEVTDDAEWTVINERITRVEELRKTQLTGGRNLAASPDKAGRAERGSPANQELEALKNAVRDQYPDAEIKARLARAHEVQQQRAAQLTRAHEELRAVLSVRQEAILVMAGVLPP
ncbi:MAG: hypothetical protein HZA93_05600 [Verrucomicrobia bacterium]|nr:hypothetical protein [Verrucomicrobiota bacterium]